MKNFDELKKYLEENSGELVRLPKEARVHYKLVKTLYENPSRLGIKLTIEKYVNVDVQKGDVDIAFLSDSDLYLVECKMDFTINNRRKAAVQLRWNYKFFSENFGIEPKLYFVFYKWGHHKKSREHRLRIEPVSKNYLEFLLS